MLRAGVINFEEIIVARGGTYIHIYIYRRKHIINISNHNVDRPGSKAREKRRRRICRAREIRERRDIRDPESRDYLTGICRWSKVSKDETQGRQGPEGGRARSRIMVFGPHGRDRADPPPSPSRFFVAERPARVL